MGRPKDQDISTPLSQCVGRDISCTFRVGRPTELGHRIYPPPLQNGWAKIDHMLSEWVGRDIFTPLPSGLAEIYHMPSEQVGWDISIPLPRGSAEIYPHPFPAGRPGYIICLQNGSAQPFQSRYSLI